MRCGTKTAACDFHDSKPLQNLQDAYEASTAETKVFLLRHTMDARLQVLQIIKALSQTSKGLTVFKGIILITNFLIYRPVNILPFSGLKCNQ